MEKAYEPQDVEGQRYAAWESNEAFKASVTPGAKKYSITIPPPNVTGKLHMGHALCYTVQDALGRWRRMSGDQVLILPGTDHAGIATQNVVEKQLAERGICRQEIGREKFVEHVWVWKDEYGATIVSQLKRLGCSFDWSRERFTFDEGYVEAVLEAFVRFHDQGLIYRGNRLINWCPRCRTVISDIEVEEVDLPGHLWHIRYPFADGSGHVTVATTRPETMLGDTAVAVNPADERYFGLVGKMLKLPLTEREIPLIADDYASLEMGTGAVKVTPAHDPNDYEAGKRNNLPMITVIGLDAAMTAEAGPAYAGLDRYAAREKIVEDLEALGLLELVEDRPHRVPTCERCHTVIEPLLSDQWFMKMGGTELVHRAIEVVEKDEITFAPERYKGIYLDWMRNLRDWPLSRQLWWGHRIPIYYKQDGTWVAAKSLQEARVKAGTNDLTQDEDVLDTWFSSALWPFATLAPSGSTAGWPTPTAEFDYFYPTNVLTTSREILYLWVARMIMAGLEFTGNKPFEQVYIFATVLDKKGRRMSKSLGNGIDPVEMIEKYGADALRFSLLRLASKGQDIRFSEERIPESRNFTNKLWNAARFVLGNLKDCDANYSEPSSETVGAGAGYSHADLWILSKLNEAVHKVTDSYASFDFDLACAAIYDFVWNQYCDWYLELSKPMLQSDDAEGARQTRTVLLHCLSTALRLMHPILPYVTEEIWQNLPSGTGRETESIMTAIFPKPHGFYGDSELVVTRLIDSITALRSLRAEYTPGGVENEAVRAAMLNRRFTVTAVPGDSHAAAMLETELTPLITLARLGLVIAADSPPTNGRYIATQVRGLDLYIPASELLEGIDPAREARRLDEDLKKLEKELGPVSAKLANPGFLERAAEEVVAKTRADFEELTQRRVKLEARRQLVQELGV